MLTPIKYKIHFCSKFLNETKKNIQFSNLGKKIKDDLEHEDLNSLGNITFFSPDFYVYSVSQPEVKIILQTQIIDYNNKKHRVLFVRDLIFSKNLNFIYAKEIHPLFRSNKWGKLNPIDEVDFTQLKLNLEKDVISENKIKETPPPTNLTDWFSEYKFKISYDVFELDSWVKYSQRNSIAEGLQESDIKLFGLLIKELVSDETLKGIFLFSEDRIDVFEVKKNGLGLLYSKIIIEEKPIFIIIAGANIQLQQEYWENIKLHHINTELKFDAELESISRVAYRAYPKWTLTNLEQWYSIQKNSELCNLSLLREQVDFFNKFSFPQYINGQAGSGKSTMLYYLFANAYWFMTQDEIKGDIIFLTENEYLLKHTKDAVFDLLSNNPDFEGLTFDVRSKSQEKFASFKNYLIDLLPSQFKTEFQMQKYLNFSIFKSLYENSYLTSSIKSKYSAEESWFTIITYVYGHDLNTITTSDNYVEKIDKKSRLIPLEVFKGIETNVLPFYNKLINEEDYWDKLKLIRFLDRENITPPSYTIVICDEAQDFCRVELNFILRLSKYLKYNLSTVDEVPIVFAGDPNQTVNPTGFREAEMIGMMYSELKEISKFNFEKDNSVYKPIYNYRSNQAVVTLANCVQYYRKKSLQIRLSSYQVARKPSLINISNINVFLDYETIHKDKKLRDDLSEKLKYKVFIVPVDSQEKSAFSILNPLLSYIGTTVEIKTSVEAKGAEYEQIVLVGFGEHFLKQHGSLEFQTIDDDLLFSLRYFFNKLYVAITRAQSELIIIDSTKSKSDFWKKLIDDVDVRDSEWSELTEQVKGVIGYDAGSVNNIVKSTKKIALVNANTDREMGMLDQNPSRLKVAANQFINLSMKQEAYECFAYSEQYLGNFKTAAAYFLNPEIGDKKYDLASESLFIGKHFTELIDDIGSQFKSINHRLRLVLAKIMINSRIGDTDVIFLHKHVDKLSNVIFDLIWRNKLIEKLIKIDIANYSIEHQRIFMKTLEKVGKHKDIELWEKIANYYFKELLYEEASAIWERTGNISHENYVKCKILYYRDKMDVISEVIWMGESRNYLTSGLELNKLNANILEKHLKGSNVFDEKYLETVLTSAISEHSLQIIHKVEQDLEKQLENDKLIELYENQISTNTSNKIITRQLIDRYIYQFTLKGDSHVNLDKLNDQLSKLLKGPKIKFNNITIDYMNDIPEIPELIKTESPSHITSIKTTSFKKFKTFSIDDLGMFNVVVGDNNVGKTSVLEMLMLTGDSTELCKRLAILTIERRNPLQLLNEDDEEIFHLKGNYIEEYVNTNSTIKEFSFSLKKGRKEWSYTVCEHDNTWMIKSDFEEDEMNYKDFSKSVSGSDLMSSSFISFGKSFHRELAKFYYDKIEVSKPLRKDFLDSMKLFIPEIDRISVDTLNATIHIEELNKDNGIELHQYGEGALKLFRILLGLHVNKNNRLLIDEIDAGIHHSRFKDFWEIIIKNAQKLNVQIFVTTHNIECIEAYKNVFEYEDLEEERKQARIVTLRENDNLDVITFTRKFENFKYELDSEVEIRGGIL